MLSELFRRISEEKKNERAYMGIQQDILHIFGNNFYNEDQTRMFSFCDCRLHPNKNVMKLHIQLTVKPSVQQIELYKERYQEEWSNREIDREEFLHTCFQGIEKQVLRNFSYATRIKDDITIGEKEGVVKRIDIHFYIEIELSGNLTIVLSKKIRRSLQNMKESFLHSTWDA
ncbi:hypothetical protein ACFVS2_25550 [Brevibacillus sp. NPDC058079]|uniref:hypothetical protein n=1 Tax=Brevibacillus sp. NPDC058079 TaxID=3346330 RepID=UPI0036EC4D4F